VPYAWKKALVLLALVLGVSLAAGYAVIKGAGSLAVVGATGLLLLPFLLRSDYRLPVLLLWGSLLMADASHSLLREAGLKLRWVILGVLLFKELGCWAFRKNIYARFTGTHLVFGLFCLTAVSSAFLSVAPTLTFARSLSVGMFYLVIFFYFWRQCAEARTRRDLLSVIAAAVPAVYLLEVVWALAAPGTAWHGGRLRALSINPNGLGGLVMLTLPFLVWEGLRRGRRLPRAYLWLGLALGLALLVLSGSRASLAGTGVAVLLLVLRLRPAYFLAAALGVVMLGILAFFYGLGPAEVGARARRYGPVADRLRVGELGGRTEAWRAALRLGGERPLAGHGFGTALQVLGGVEFRRHQGGYPHNFLLHAFLDLGALGVALVLLLHGTLLAAAGRCLRHDGPPGEQGAHLLATSLYLAGTLNAFFENWMFSAGSAMAFPYWLMTMLMVRYAVLLRDADERRQDLVQASRLMGWT
jgi:O-antigen ligase